MKSRRVCIPVALLWLAMTSRTYADEELARKYGCLECHSVQSKIIGPAYEDVAARYRGDSNARAALIAKVGRGGKGNWTHVTGGVPMPPFGLRAQSADIERLVDWVLSR